MLKYIVFSLILLIEQNCIAQNISGSVQQQMHPATVAESEATGLARLMAAKGIYLEHLGDYLIKLQIANKQAFDNSVARIRERWKIKDEGAAREKASHKNHIDIQNEKFDMLEKMHVLKLREQDLINKGILPKPEPSMVIQGKKYKNYSEFKNSKERELMITLKSIEQDLENLESEQKYKDAVKFEINRRLIYRSFTSPIGFY